MQNRKWLSEEDLKRAEKREEKGKRVKERYTNLNVVSMNSLKI